MLVAAPARVRARMPSQPAPRTSRRAPPEIPDVKIPSDEIARYNQNPLYRTIGIHLEFVADGDAQAVLTPQEAVCWPTPGQPHGGILFTVLDTTMAFAAMSAPEQESSCATVDCNVQYLAPARQGPFLCQARTVRRTGRTVFVRAEILDAHQAPVALAQGTFRLIAPRHA